MFVERNLLISLLKLTKNGPAFTELVNKEAHLPAETTLKLLAKLQNEDLVYLKQGYIEVTSGCRIKLAVQAIALGADVESVSNLLCWQEFEEITGVTLRNNEYTVSNNVRFKQGGRRWEIDVVGCRKPLVVCIDCKHWKHSIAPSALKRIVNEQIERTCALRDFLPNPDSNIECTQWHNAKFVPVVLSLMPSAFKFYCDTPIVPILGVQDFINQLPVYIESLKYFSKTFNQLSHHL